MWVRGLVLLAFLATACGGSKGAPDLSTVWPNEDPSADAGDYGGPSFGDGGVPAAIACEGKTGATGTPVVSVTSGGLPRTAFLHVPDLWARPGPAQSPR